jgi:hypothetical protein
LTPLVAHLGLDQLEEDRSLRQPERHPGALLAQHEEAELRAELAVVVLPCLRKRLQVRDEVGLRVKGRPVDPRQHLAVLVSPPVGAGDRGQLKRLDPPGGRRVRAAA